MTNHRRLDVDYQKSIIDVVHMTTRRDSFINFPSMKILFSLGAYYFIHKFLLFIANWYFHIHHSHPSCDARPCKKCNKRHNFACCTNLYYNSPNCSRYGRLRTDRDPLSNKCAFRKRLISKLVDRIDCIYDNVENIISSLNVFHPRLRALF